MKKNAHEYFYVQHIKQLIQYVFQIFIVKQHNYIQVIKHFSKVIIINILFL